MRELYYVHPSGGENLFQNLLRLGVFFFLMALSLSLKRNFYEPKPYRPNQQEPHTSGRQCGGEHPMIP